MNNYLPMGEETYLEFEDRTKRGYPQRVQYDYRHIDNTLYSTIADNLGEARVRRDAWIKRKTSGGNAYVNKETKC